MSIEMKLREASQGIKEATRQADFTSRSPAERRPGISGPMVAWMGGLAVLALVAAPAVLVGVGGQPSGGAELASAPTPVEFPHLILNLPDTELVDAYENFDETGERAGTHTVYLQTWTISEGEAAGEVGRREILLRIQEAGAVFDEFDYYSALTERTETVEVNGRSVTVHLVPDEAIEEGSYDLGILQWTEAPGYEVILIPWGLDKDGALSVMDGLTRISESEWEQLRGPKDGPSVTTTVVESETTTTGATPTPAPVQHEVPSFSVEEIDRTFSPDDATWNDPAFADVVADELASTGEEYDELPDEYVPDAAALNGRVVVVGGNSEQTARIWYSDGGPWIEAEIQLPSGMQIGDEPGQHRLADGIGNVEVIGGRFVAWETAQPVLTAEEFDSPETLLLTSPDGSVWTARTVDGSFRALIPWEGGALVVATHDWAYSNVLWSADLEDWVEIAELGPVGVEAIDVEDASIDLAVREYSMNVSNETGETYHTDDGARRTIRLSPTS